MMKVEAMMYQLPKRKTDSKPMKYKVETVAVGNRWDAERFLEHIHNYERLKQENIVDQWYNDQWED